MDISECTRCNGSGWANAAKDSGTDKLPLMHQQMGVYRCPSCGGSGKVGFDDSLIDKLAKALNNNSKPLLKDVLFKDLAHFQTFYLYGHEYVKRGRDKALWVEKDALVICDPDNLVQIKEE